MRQPRTYMILLTMSLLGLSSCYVFRKRSTDEARDSGENTAVIGKSLGLRAGEADLSALQDLYNLTSAHAPAGIRTDPDMFVRRLLLQYRELGSTVAMEIGRVENYRLLLGGANETFTVTPQENYDATSLLAQLKVADEVCTALVNPNGWTHRGWLTILPYPPTQTSLNIRFLMQRLLGVPSSRLDDAAQLQLQALLEGAKVEGQITLASYVPVCSTLLMDAEGLLL